MIEKERFCIGCNKFKSYNGIPITFPDNCLTFIEACQKFEDNKGIPDKKEYKLLIQTKDHDCPNFAKIHKKLKKQLIVPRLFKTEGCGDPKIEQVIPEGKPAVYYEIRLKLYGTEKIEKSIMTWRSLDEKKAKLISDFLNEQDFYWGPILQKAETFVDKVEL